MGDAPSQRLVTFAGTMCRPITNDMEPDDARLRYEMSQALKKAIVEWASGYEEDFTEYVKNRPAGCVRSPHMEGDQWYVVKTDRRKKLIKSKLPALLERCFEDMGFEEFAACLSANPLKHGELSNHLPDWDQFFEEVESEKPALRKTMPPGLKRLVAAEQKGGAS